MKGDDKGDYYFLIESFIYTNVKEPDLTDLNRATFRGSIIRSQLKMRLGVSSEQIAFCINRDKKAPDQVHVTLIRQSMPSSMNKDIFFSLSNAGQDISRALLRYPELVEILVKRMNTPQYKVREFVNSLQEVVGETLLKDDSGIMLQGFGTFTLWKQSARPGRNPRTGNECLIHARKSVKFKSGKFLLSALNEKDS